MNIIQIPSGTAPDCFDLKHVCHIVDRCKGSEKLDDLISLKMLDYSIISFERQVGCLGKLIIIFASNFIPNFMFRKKNNSIFHNFAIFSTTKKGYERNSKSGYYFLNRRIVLYSHEYEK